MANFFEGVENLLKHPIDEIKWMADETKGVLKPLAKGDVSESWDSFKGSFGRHNKMMEDITVPLGGRNKITENPDAAAGAIIGSIFAAPAIGGAMGGSGSSFGGFGTEGAFSKYFQPSSLPKTGLSGQGIGYQSPVAFNKTTALENPSLTNKMLGYWDSLTGPSDEVLGNMADMEADGAVGSGAEALEKAGYKGFDLEEIGKMLQSIKPSGDVSASHQRGSGSFRFDERPYKNQLLTREFDQLYGAPLQNKLY